MFSYVDQNFEGQIISLFTKKCVKIIHFLKNYEKINESCKNMACSVCRNLYSLSKMCFRRNPDNMLERDFLKRALSDLNM